MQFCLVSINKRQIKAIGFKKKCHRRALLALPRRACHPLLEDASIAADPAPPAADLAGNKEAALCQRGLSLSPLRGGRKEGVLGRMGCRGPRHAAAMQLCSNCFSVHVWGGSGEEVLAPRGGLVRHLSSYHQCCHIIEQMGCEVFTGQKQEMAKGVS